MASGDQQPRSWLLTRAWDSLQPEAPPERRRGVVGQAPALSPQQPPRQCAGCKRIIERPGVGVIRGAPGCMRSDARLLSVQAIQ